jgi:murein L,D-transpeptidase YcbB/YkuD
MLLGYFKRLIFVFCALVLVALPSIGSAQHNDISYQMALSKALKNDASALEYYKGRDFKPLWMERSFRAPGRRKALFEALAGASGHALPVERYRLAELETAVAAIKTTEDLGRVEAELTKSYLTYVRDVRAGILNPRSAVRDIKRDRLGIVSADYLAGIERSSARKFMRALPPQSVEYQRLLTEKERLLRIIAAGDWKSKVPAVKLEPGAKGKAVVALRDRLIDMGYLKSTLTAVYDGNMQKAVQAFQADHGLSMDGIVGPGTRAEINKSARDRLAAVVVAMERERWTNFDRGTRHIMVNLADFSAKIMNKGQIEFYTRAVVGSNKNDQRSPEFSDEMEHMVINPTWNVPRSITVKEYLPKMQKNPNAHSYLNLISQSGRVVSREGIDFNQYNASNFPFDLKQPPSTRNALGLVKFMFPNQYNIYLHDTPAKSLFSRETRAFSHGCVRLHKPFDFAYALLSVQSSNPKGEFHTALDSGRETVIELKKHVPVHLMYRTAVSKPTGGMEYRRDIYGRDGAIFDALVRAGVVIGSIAG